MGTSEEEGERNLEYFQGQKLFWLKTFRRGRGIRRPSEGLGDNNHYNGRGRPTHPLSTSYNTH